MQILSLGVVFLVLLDCCSSLHFLGGRYVHFASVTVRNDNLEVSISSHEVKEKKVREKMHNDSVVHLNETLLDSEWRLTKPQSEGSDLVPTPSVISTNKNTTSLPNMQDVEPNGILYLLCGFSDMIDGTVVRKQTAVAVLAQN